MLPSLLLRRASLARSRAASRRTFAAIAIAAILSAVGPTPSLVAAEPPTEVVVRAWEHERSDVPVDPSIRFGQLANGLRYALVENAEPRDRCYLRLHVRAGSLYEEESERGMAHFLEHMAFNGTEHFPPDALVTWFQEHGMAFGADTNAMTGFDQTIYEIDLPQSDEGALRGGFTVLRDFAGGMLLKDEEVDKEKGVIDGEERERDSAQARVGISVIQNLLAGTRIPDRIPIGTKEARDAFTGDSVRAFYRRWYRPDRMTLLVVGDLRGFDLAPMIDETFGALANPEGPRDPDPDLGEIPPGDRFFSVHEPEMPVAQIAINRLRPYQPRPFTQEELRRSLPRSLAYAMLNKRLQNLARQGTAPFLAAFAGDMQEGFEVVDGATLTVISGPDAWKDALAAADLELRRALEFGFDPAELEPVLADWMRSLKEAAERRDTRDSRAILGALLEAAQGGHVPMEPVAQRDLMLEISDGLSVDDCVAALRESWAEGDDVVFTAGAVDLGDDPAAVLSAALAEMRATAAEQREAEGTTTFAYSTDADPAWSRGAHVEDLDVWTYEFDNGVRLNVKRTDFKEREVSVVLDLGDGELSMTPFRPALSSVASQVFIGGGLEAHSSEDLDRILAGRQVGVSFDVGADRFTFAGSTTPDDLKLQLELMCAYLTHPGFRGERLVRLRREVPILFESLAHSLETPIAKEFEPAFLPSPRVAAFPSAEDLLAVEMSEVEGWLRPAFASAPIEVTLVGDIDVAVAVDHAARTLGRLPKRAAPGSTDEQRAVAAPRAGLRMDSSVDTKVPKALVRVAFPTTDGIDAGTRRTQHLVSLVLSDRLRAEIRERLGAAYSPQAFASSSRVFPGIGHIDAHILAEPSRADDVVAATLAVAESLRSDGISAEELDRIREPELKRIRDLMRSNGAWLEWIRAAQRHPESLDDARGLLDFYREVAPEQLTEVARRYLAPSRASVMVVTPATSSDGDAGPR